MSNWTLLNRSRAGQGTVFESTPADGCNGFFCLVLRGAKVNCIASDGMGWKHVSVSIDKSKQPPNWAIMCDVKDLFWDAEDIVVQFHPRKSEYVNHHPGCLHLWQCTDGRQQPTPDSILVGPKT